MADQPAATSCCSRRRARAATTPRRCARASPRSRSSRRSPTRGAPSTSTALLAHYLATDAVARAIAGAPRVEINTDDRNIVEFGLARSVGRSGIEPAGRSARARATRWARRARRSTAMPASTGRRSTRPGDTSSDWDASPAMLRGAAADEQPRQAALRRYYQDERHGGRARALAPADRAAARSDRSWRWRPTSRRTTGSDTALPLIERLRGVPAGRGGHRPRVAPRLRQSRLDEAATALRVGVRATARRIRGRCCGSSRRRSTLAGAVGARRPGDSAQAAVRRARAAVQRARGRHPARC